MKFMSKRFLLAAVLSCLLICLAAFALYRLPVINEPLGWRIEGLQTQLQRYLNPPEQQVFIPKGQASLSTASTELVNPAASDAPEEPSMPAATNELPPPTGTPLAAPTPRDTPTPLPEQVVLSGVVHEYQQFNNCGPATLSMALSYWGWQGDQRATRASLRPNFASVDDKNVNPWEMVKFVEANSKLLALQRVGGDLEMLKALLAAGFPLMIEIGIQQHPGDWMGHYLLLNGYDDQRARFTTQDALVGPDLPVGYEQVEAGWRAFNNVFLIVYPAESQAIIDSIMGEQADPQANLQSAAQKASQETTQLSGRDLFFAWYNLGTSLTTLGDYPGAAQAFDQAFSIYPMISEEDRPWRMLWYQSGPYESYFNTGRYQDVIELGNQVLNLAGGPLLEETFYWLGKAREATGDIEKALYDYNKAIEINPDSTPAQAALQRLGANNP